jgi:hypothetical protein
MFATATEAIEHISTKAKSNQETRIIKAIKPGQMIRQGDIYAINVDGMTSMEVFQTVKVDFKNYTSKVKTNKTHYQLVPGSTKGSRHTVKNDLEIFVNPTNDSSLVGPLIKSQKDFVIEHPEHAHFQLPAGTYLICYQMNDKTKQRVKD